MNSASFKFGLAFLLACTPNYALAKNIPDGGVTVDELAAWLHSGGYQANIQTMKDGQHSIETGADGIPFHITLYDCKNARCGSIQFVYGLDTKGRFNAVKMNAWNRHERWARAYVDDVNDPWLEYDVDLTPGGTYELLGDEFGVWRNALRDFRAVVAK